MATQIRYTYRFSVHTLPDEAVDPFNAVLWQKCVEVAP